MDNNFNNLNGATTPQSDVVQPNMPLPNPQTGMGQNGLADSMEGMSQTLPLQPGMMPNDSVNPQTEMSEANTDELKFAMPQQNTQQQQTSFVAPMGGMPQPNMEQPQTGFVQPMGMGQSSVGMAQSPMGMNQSTMSGGKPPKVKKPMSGGKIAAIIGGSVAGVAAIVCGILFIPKLFKPAKDVVVDAFENTFAIETNEESKSYLQENADLDAIMDKYYAEGGQVSMSVTLNEVYGEEAPYDLTFSMNNQYDPIQKLVNISMALDADDNNVLAVNVIGDETTTYIELEDIIDGYFTLPNDEPFIALQNSPLGEAMELYDMPSTSFDYFSASTDSSSNTELNAGYVSAVEGLWDAVTVEKEGKAKIDVNGTTVKATEYIITLKNDDIIDALTTIIDSSMDDAYIAEYATANGMSVSEVETTMEQFKALLPTLIPNDLNVKVYVKDDKVVKITCEDKISLYGVSLSYSFFLDIDDENVSGEFAMDVMGEEIVISLDIKELNTTPTGTIKLEYGGEVLGIDFAYADDITDSKENMQFDMSVYEGDEYLLTAQVATNIDKTNDTFDGSIVFYMEDVADCEVIFTGAFGDFNKGVGYSQTFDSIEVILDGESIADVSATYAIDTSSVNAQPVDSSAAIYDLTAITESEFTDIISDNVDLIAEWVDNVMYNTGAFGEDLSNILYGSSYEDDYYYEEEEEITVSQEDAILIDGNAQVQLTGTIDGFTLDYVDSLWVEYITEEYSSLVYYLYSNVPAADVLAGGEYYFPSEDDYTIYDSAYNQQITLSDGSVVTYSYIQYDSYGFTVNSYVFVVEIAPNLILTANAYIYVDDDPFTVEQLAEAMSSQYYTIISGAE